MKPKRQKQEEALGRLEENIKMRERSLKRVADDIEDKGLVEESIKFLKTKLINLNRDLTNLKKKLEY